MNQTGWNAYAPYFSPKEKWGNPAAVQWVLVHALFLIRRELRDFGRDWPIIVHDATGPGHSPTGYHPKGLAVDFHFGAADCVLFDQGIALHQVLRDLRLFDFVGLGVYPDWQHPGFHLDVRGENARWGRIGGSYVSWERAMTEAAKVG